MTIKFFIVAFLYYAWSVDDPIIKINTNKEFKTFEGCVNVLMSNRKGLQDSLMREYPNVDRFTLRCVDTRTLYQMQLQSGNKNEQKT